MMGQFCAISVIRKSYLLIDVITKTRADVNDLRFFFKINQEGCYILVGCITDIVECA